MDYISKLNNIFVLSESEFEYIDIPGPWKEDEHGNRVRTKMEAKVIGEKEGIKYVIPVSLDGRPFDGTVRLNTIAPGKHFSLDLNSTIIGTVKTSPGIMAVDVPTDKKYWMGYGYTKTGWKHETERKVTGTTPMKVTWYDLARGIEPDMMPRQLPGKTMVYEVKKIGQKSSIPPRKKLPWEK